MAKYSYITDKTNNNRKIQVESAKRDGQGKKIDETYFPIGGFDSTATVGTAEQLLLNKYVEDNEPFLYRTTGGSADVGDRMGFNSLVGGTIVFNQLVQNGNFESIDNWTNSNSTLSVSSNVGSLLSTAQFGQVYQRLNVLTTHKYLIIATVKLSSSISTNDVVLAYDSGVSYKSLENTTSWQTISVIFSPSVSGQRYVGVVDRRISDWDTIQVKNFMVIDLTLMFGSTIADYIYGLGNTNGVAWFRKYFPLNYYAYTTAKMLSTRPVSKTNTGFNQWDEDVESGNIDNDTGIDIEATGWIRSKNYQRALTNTTYYAYTPSEAIRVFFYDENKNYISNVSVYNTTFTSPSNAYYFRLKQYVSTYNHDICINISHSGTHNGEYEPYEEHEYALGSDILRGIWKLDSNNNLYFDGDTKTPDGTITRKYGIVDLGTIVWSYDSTNQVFNGNAPSDMKSVEYGVVANMRCSLYMTTTFAGTSNNMTIGQSTVFLRIKNTSYTDAGTFRSAMSGVYLVYELATSTTETGTAYDKLEIINDWGTENAVVNAYNESTQEDDDSIALPLGHDSYYYPNASDKLGNSPDLPSDTGYYVMHYESTGREATYTLLSTWLSANGYSAIQDLSSSVELATGITASFLKCYKVGNIITLTFNVRNTSGSNINSGSTIATISSSICPNSVVFRVDVGGSDTRAVISHIFHTLTFGADFNNNAVAYVSISYAVE